MCKLIVPCTFALAFALASCGGNQAANNAAVSEDTEGADVTTVNDTTAIDAATAQDANMAADVDYTVDENATNESGNDSESRPNFPPDEPGPTNNSAD
jgi:hypothetical protein